MVKETVDIRQRDRNDGCDKAMEEEVGLAEELSFDLENEERHILL